MAGMLEGSLSVLCSPEIIQPKRARRLYGAFLEYAVMSDQLLKVADVARRLNCHKQSIYKLVACRRIPFEKIVGVGVRFDPAKFEKWIAGQSIGKAG
jgi:excisionase family DNA binding protein